MPTESFGRGRKGKDTPKPKKVLKTRSVKDTEPEEMDTPDDSLLDRIEGELDLDGIRLFDNKNVDAEYLELPQDLSEVESRELGKYLHAFTQQKMWTRTLISRVSTMNKESLKRVNVIRDTIYQTLPKGMAVKEKELRLSNHPEASKLLDNYDFYSSKLDVLTYYIESVEDGIFSISREITRRNSDWNTDRREDNIGRKRR